MLKTTTRVIVIVCFLVTWGPFARIYEINADVQTADSGAQNASEMPTDPQMILDSAAKLNGLSDPSVLPWHIKATYQVFEQDGKAPISGWTAVRGAASNSCRPLADLLDEMRRVQQKAGISSRRQNPRESTEHHLWHCVKCRSGSNRWARCWRRTSFPFTRNSRGGLEAGKRVAGYGGERWSTIQRIQREPVDTGARGCRMQADRPTGAIA